MGPVYIRVVNEIKKTHLYPNRYRKKLIKFYSNLINLIIIITDIGAKKKSGSFVQNRKGAGTARNPMTHWFAAQNA